MPRRSWSNLSIRLAWSRSTSALSRRGAMQQLGGPLYRCGTALVAGSFAKAKIFSRVHCESAN